MKYIIFFLIIWGNWVSAYGTDSLRYRLGQLDAEIAKRGSYLARKDSVIRDLKNKLVAVPATDDERQFCLTSRIYQEYKSFQYDSAYHYASRSLYWAERLKDKDKILSANGNLLFCFFSGGAFKEAADIAGNVPLEGTSPAARGEFYALCTRLYSDMYNYARVDDLRLRYQKNIISYRDSVLRLLPDTSYTYQEMRALFGLDLSVEERIRACQHLMEIAGTRHQKAIITSNLASLYLLQKDTLQAMDYLVDAAVFDLQEGIMETTAKTELARCLYAMGDYNVANRYVHIALEEANFYNASHRIVSINAILPIIEEAYLATITGQRDNLKKYLMLVSLLSVVALAGILLIYWQKRKLKTAGRAIEQQSRTLKELNEIKDAYIMQAICAKSDYLDKTDAILKKADYRIRSKQFTDLNRIFGEFNLKEERKNLYLSFDQTFLMLFPSFIEEFNRLFEEKDRFQVDGGPGLTTELRIFALIRLGITENEEIARFLNLSVNTIYTYKAKIKSKSLVPKEDFDEYIKRIPKHNA